MRTKEWDRDIENSRNTLSDERFINEEMKQHMYNLWRLSGGKIGERPPMIHRTISELFKEREK